MLSRVREMWHCVIGHERDLVGVVGVVVSSSTRNDIEPRILNIELRGKCEGFC